jgi:hypothetical protein
MAEDKRIRIAADTTPLRQLREEAVSLYREINQTSMQSAQEAEKSISQLREQLALMEDRNELERLLLDLKRQSAAIDATTMQKPSPMPERPIRRQPPTEELPRPEQPTIDPETGSITWDVSPRRKEEPVQPEPRLETDVEEPEEKPAPRRRRRKVQEPIPDVEPIIDEETGSMTWDVSPRRKEEPVQPEPRLETDVEEPEEKPAPRRRRRKVQEPIPDVEPIIDEETGSMTWDLTRKPQRERVTPIERGVEREEPTTKETQKEILREINRHVENIDESVTNVDNSKNFQDNSENRTDNSRHTENITENVVNIEKNTQTITENTTAIREKGNLEVVSEQPNRPLLREDDRIQRRPEITDNGQTEIKFSDEGIIRAITRLGVVTDNIGRDVISALRGLEKGTGEENQRTSITRYLETIANSVSVIEDSAENILEEIQKAVSGSGFGGGTGTPGGIVPPTGSTGGIGGGLNIFGGGLKGILGGLGALTAFNTAKNVLSERYFRQQEFEARSQYQGTVETAANYTRLQAANQADAFRWIPLIGDTIAKSIELPAQLAAEKMMATFGKYAEGERRVIPYAQVMGVSAGEAFRQAGREGSYAAESLGMDYASYLGRRAELIRAGGGRFVGGNEYDPYAVRETQSVMAAERLFGLSPNAVNRLQGAMRFGDQDSGTGASAIIREFEQAMKNLGIPFEQIASTMEESLDTFITQSDQILSKRGEFDAKELAAMFSGIRQATGLQGRQLERVQQAFTGQGISKDEVTNAMLVRSIQEVMPDKTSYSEIQEELEKIRAGAADPEVMENFLNRVVERTGGGSEQLRLAMSEIFPNLSWNDINSTIQKDSDPSKLVSNLFDLYKQASQRIRETPTEAYDRDAARRTVGTGETILASDMNRQMSEGANILGEIRDLVREINDRGKKVADMELEVPKEKIIQQSATGGSGLVNMSTVSGGVDAGRAISQWFKRALDEWARERVNGVSEANKVIQQER